MPGGRGTFRGAAPLGSALLAIGMLAGGGCTPTTKTQGGLELIIAADGLSAPADFDKILLQVSQQSDGGSWNQLWGKDYDVPSQEATLPATFAIIAGQSAYEEVLIVLTAFKLGQPVVQRVAQVQAPTDRVAALWLVLAEVCRGQVTVVGAEGEPMSTCPSGQSCQPSTGGCGSSVISDPSSLPTYAPGESLDAAPAGAVVANAEAEGGAGDVTPETDSAPNAADATSAADSGRDAAEGEAGGVAGAGDASLSADSASDAMGSAGSGGEAGAADAPMVSDSASDAVETGSSGGSVGASCQTSGPGLSNCGASSESCCTSLEVTGGMYDRTYTNAGTGATGMADPATVSSFRLDKYLVTVGRFRQFVAAWNLGAGYTPPAGSGKHTHLNGGSGLSATGGGYEPGWVMTDNVNIAPTNANLACETTSDTWTNTAGTQETLPIDCVNWYESYAFCIWDGGFLPSEAEWEYAAAGGSQHREYPWGSTDPGASNEYAIYDCDYPSGSGICMGVANIAPVGAATLGAGRWGQLNLVGELWEWNLDWYAAYVDPCTDCVDTTAASNRVLRGGDFYIAGGASFLLPPYRNNYAPTNRSFNLGFRCSRTP